MGICSSCDSTAIATATAKLILHDGTLQEFSHPIKVSQVLQKHPSTFICNSDELEFHDVVSAVSDDDVLRPGEIYFALPLSRLRRRLQPEEMAALAVKASSALTKGGGERCGCRRGNQLRLNAPAPVVSKIKGSGGGSRSGRRRDFTAMLTVIPE